MRTAIVIAALLLTAATAFAAEGDVEQAVKNKNLGTVYLMAPADWTPVERIQTESGTTFYRLIPPKKDFDVELLFNDLAHMRMEALVDKDLERYIETNMATAAPESVEGKAKAVRFGPKSDGVYVRLTDKAPSPGDPVYFTQGVRLLGADAVLFTLYSNDEDGSALRRVLEIVESVRVEQ
jgi:hypothetical protein